MTEKISAPEVTKVIQQLRAAREQHANIVAETPVAESDLRQIDAEIERLKARVAERELEVARSAGPLPDDSFPEEPEIARAERKQRVLTARVKMFRERALRNQQCIDELKNKLQSAFLQVGKEIYEQTVAEYREAALRVRDLRAQMNACMEVFPVLFRDSPRFPVIIVDPLSRKAEDRFIVNNLINGEQFWKPLAGDLLAALQELRALVEGAKADDPEQFSTGGQS